MQYKNQTIRSGYDEHVFVLKAMFYLLSPEETYYEFKEDVPDITGKASKYFLGMILMEQIISLIKNGRFNGRISDGITSIGAGIVHGIPNFFFRSVSITTYEWVYENFCIIESPWNSMFTYLFAFLFVDMMYYWFHRAAHEINLFWAAHQTHHSSEEYNLTTALRQSIFQKYTSWAFYLPVALFIRPSIFIVHSHMNLIYQFWIHTNVVKSIGPLEHILNTPSHHRVHHGRNPYCIDKNYAGVLIIWDKIFGTFEPEKPDEELAYGLVHPLESFDPIHIQVHNYQYLIKKFWETKGLSNKLSVLFKGPGWVPGTKRLGNHEDLPKIKYPIVKKGSDIQLALNIYVALHFSFISILFAEFIGNFQTYPPLILSLFIMMIMFNLTSFGMYFDAKPYAMYVDLVRCFLQVSITVLYESEIKKLFFSSEILTQVYKFFNAYSFLVIFVIAILKAKDFVCEKIKQRMTTKDLVNKVKYSEYERVKSIHKHFHMKMAMKNQTIRCSKDPNFTEY